MLDFSTKWNDFPAVFFHSVEKCLTFPQNGMIFPQFSSIPWKKCLTFPQNGMIFPQFSSILWKKLAAGGVTLLCLRGLSCGAHGAPVVAGGGYACGVVVHRRWRMISGGVVHL
ncbi:MAG: hypothetical protein ACI4PY_10350 [Akkermansia muciniphila]